jgi:hypothetical protein
MKEIEKLVLKQTELAEQAYSVFPTEACVW